jgi:phenylacetic acid degradation operon negative regulatory protein
MKITLRKKDSVTSAVLFIFNLLGELKNEYSIKLSILLKILQYFNKSEASIRTGISRMVKADILSTIKVDNETIYKLNQEGLKNIELWNKGLDRFFSRFELRQKDWKNNWCLLTLIDFNRSEYENVFILEELKECGLREINHNMWITPYDIDNDLITLLKNQTIKYLVFSGEFVTIDNLNNLLNTTFEINLLQEKYMTFIDKIRKNSNSMNELDQGYLLPILFELGWDFYDITIMDAMLPQEIIHQWVGDKAVHEMKLIRAELLSRIMDYFKKNNI